MRQKNILNLLLLVAGLSLAGIIYLSEERSLDLEKISDTASTEIDNITIRHNDQLSTYSRQDDGSWQMTHPLHIAANDFRINSLLKIIEAPRHSTYTITEVDLDSLGLSRPATSIQLDDQKIEFGIANPATGLRFIRMGDTISTIEDVYFPLLSSHFSTLVSLSLLPYDKTLSKLILLDQTLSKDNDGLWRSNSDLGSDRIIETVQHWQHDQAFAVHEHLQRHELGDLYLYLEGQQEAVHFVISDTDPWLILARPELGLEYHLDMEAYDTLITPR